MTKLGKLWPGLLACCLAGIALVSCGGSDSSQPEMASCSIRRSELGPFSPNTPLGQSMSEEQARARMAQDDIVEWLAVTADGPWDRSWEAATATLGQSIHLDLTWIDVNGRIDGLYAAGDAFTFDDLRVSRSFQGKIEHSDDPLYLPLQVGTVPVNFDASCTVTAVEIGDAGNELLLDVRPAL